jgi:hypothetical protein
VYRELKMLTGSSSKPQSVLRARRSGQKEEEEDNLTSGSCSSSRYCLVGRRTKMTYKHLPRFALTVLWITTSAFVFPTFPHLSPANSFD